MFSSFEAGLQEHILDFEPEAREHDSASQLMKQAQGAGRQNGAAYRLQFSHSRIAARRTTHNPHQANAR